MFPGMTTGNASLSNWCLEKRSGRQFGLILAQHFGDAQQEVPATLKRLHVIRADAAVAHVGAL